MAKQLDREWVEAQKIVISINLIAATKKHLEFLEVVDKNGNLYDGPALEKAIFRYKYYWLPLLAEYTESSQLLESPLVVPLDCEWIWHCHRLNPVRYMADCIELFGKILDPGCVVVSSIDGGCKKQTEEIWKKKYPQEAYEHEIGFKNVNQTQSTNLQSTNYDLVAAIRRQSSFFHKVSGGIFRENLYLEGAVERYKGFLHLVSKNIEKKLDNPVVPTYDIDLIWHTHQLSPHSYCKDVMALVGQVLHHDDNDTDQSEGGMLDVGIKTTTQQWKEMFGSEYWRVGSRPSVDMMKGRDSSAMTARCWCLSKQKDGEKLIKESISSSAMTTRCWCLSMQKDGEKLIKESISSCAMTARCMCLSEQMDAQKLMIDSIASGASTARCMCLSEQMDAHKLIIESIASGAMTARCMCLSEQMDGQKLIIESIASGTMTARCMCLSEQMDGKKLITKSIVSGAMTARCMCLSQQMDGQNLIIESTASGAIEV